MVYLLEGYLLEFIFLVTKKKYTLSSVSTTMQITLPVQVLKTDDFSNYISVICESDVFFSHLKYYKIF